ncbi:MAG: Ig-like domain-containing protein [Clostridia bacterium]|nr:Ig-like domain-containing protein [Clostridia bacterium]
MKKTKLIKGILLILLSVVLIGTTGVYAASLDDDVDGLLDDFSSSNTVFNNTSSNKASSNSSANNTSANNTATNKTATNSTSANNTATNKTATNSTSANKTNTSDYNNTNSENLPKTGVGFGHYTPEHAKILNKEYGFLIYLYNIPDTEKGNIKVSIENEKIAELTGIDLCNLEDGSGKGKIIANAKFLKVGQTKITATLNYNGKTYSDTFEFDVVESAYSLTISAKEYTELPSSFEVGDKIQLTTMLHIYGGSLLPEDVTFKGVTYTSSDEKVVIIDDKGLFTAIGEGTATITAKYKVGDETISAKYELKITDPTKSPANSGNSSEPTNTSSSDSPTTKSDPTTSPTILPKTGENSTIMIIGIILIVAISMIMYIKYKDYKDIK